MDIGFVISAFVAGIIMFLAPCTLPIVPGYLGFISGVKEDDLKDPEKAKKARRQIVKSAFFFVLGFSALFILFGVLAGLAGRQLVAYQDVLTKIGGVFVIFFGLFMLGVFNLKFLKMDKKMKMPKWIKPGNPTSSFVIGSTFAIGWSPCVGPILASILVLAGTSETVLQGAFLLAVFSLGLGIPFMLVAFLYSKATAYIKKLSGLLNVISKVGGVFLLGIGILLLTDSFFLLLQWGYELFDFIDYQALEQYL